MLNRKGVICIDWLTGLATLLTLACCVLMSFWTIRFIFKGWTMVSMMAVTPAFYFFTASCAAVACVGWTFSVKNRSDLETYQRFSPIIFAGVAVAYLTLGFLWLYY